MLTDVKKNAWVTSIDPLRGLAALSVVFCHVLQSSVESVDVLKVAEFLGAFGVALFFIISGFCIHYPNVDKEKIDLKLFFYKRFYRLYPTYVAALILSSIIGYFYGGHLLTSPNISTFLSHLFFVNNFISSEHFNAINTVFWTISMEIYFYLVYPLLFWFNKKASWRIMLPALLFVSLLIYFLASTLLKNELRFIFQHIFLVYWWQWALGAWIADMYRKGRLHFSFLKTSLASFVLLLAFLIYYFDLVIFNLHIKIYTTPLLLFLFLALIVRTTNNDVVTRFFKVLGGFSYSLYLTHTVFLAIIKHFLNLSLSQTIILGVPLCIVFSYIFFLLFEKRYLSQNRNFIFIENK